MAPAEERRGLKRRRIPVACSNCRNKKSRCDGSRPKCSTCIEHSLDCVYAQTPISSTTPVPRQFLELVETRLANLENDVRLLKRQNRDGPGRALDENEEETPSNSTVSNEVALGELDEMHASADATDGVGSIEFTDQNNSAYFGPSSNITFMRKIRGALTYILKLLDCPVQIDPVPRRTGSSPEASLAITRPQSPGSQPLHISDASMADSLSLPSPDEVHALVEDYFATTGVLFPFVYKATFMEALVKAQRENFRALRRSWLGLLNIILAMATNTESTMFKSTSDRAARAEVFFSRSEALSIKQTMSGTTVETVQTLLLMGLYLQGTNRSVKTWNIHGLAVKAAFHLGLHFNDPSRKFSAIDREIRARTWFGCVVLDRTLSMTFGRPSAIPENYIRIPLPEIRGFSSSRHVGREDPEALSTVFFNETIKLYKIMWLALETLYESNIGFRADTKVFAIHTDILPIEQQLKEWRSSLTPVLTLTTAQELSEDEEAYSLSKRLRVILSLRYHSLCILVNRPILDFCLQNLEDVRDSDTYQALMLREFGGQNCRASLESAIAIIDTVHTILHSSKLSRQLLGAWWFTFYYTFNATLTIAAVMLVDRSRFPGSRDFSGMQDDVLKEYLDKAINCLPLVDPGNRMVSKCTQVTSTIRGYLDLVASSNLPDDQLENINAEVAVVDFPIDPTHIGLDWLPDGFDPILQSDVVDGSCDMNVFY
ncbi:fungal-specific transcription factor domain-containing protein [Pestalotiopsis sp. NC0098]|nr:fungal-specific transcription factor domain-containing protein [Pestalotiopsis sp. NC0098]